MAASARAHTHNFYKASMAHANLLGCLSSLQNTLIKQHPIHFCFIRSNKDKFGVRAVTNPSPAPQLVPQLHSQQGADRPGMFSKLRRSHRGRQGATSPARAVQGIRINLQLPKAAARCLSTLSWPCAMLRGHAIATDKFAPVAVQPSGSRPQLQNQPASFAPFARTNSNPNQASHQTPKFQTRGVLWRNMLNNSALKGND